MKVAVVVSSCDYFSDCWEPMFLSLSRCWPDCKYPVYFVSNHQNIEAPPNVTFIRVGEDRLFSANLKLALLQIDADYIIYLQEDYWLTQRVSTSAINEHITFAESHDVDYLRLSFPYQLGTVVNDKYCQLPLTQKYALCLQAAIWKRETMLKLLIDGHSGWDFEYMIQKYALQNDIKVKAYCLREKFMSDGVQYVEGTAVRKGRWTRAAVLFLQENGFSYLLNKRKTEGLILSFLQKIQGRLRPCALCVVKLMKILNLNI